MSDVPAGPAVCPTRLGGKIDENRCKTVSSERNSALKIFRVWKKLKNGGDGRGEASVDRLHTAYGLASEMWMKRQKPKIIPELSGGNKCPAAQKLFYAFLKVRWTVDVEMRRNLKILKFPWHHTWLDMTR